MLLGCQSNDPIDLSTLRSSADVHCDVTPAFCQVCRFHRPSNSPAFLDCSDVDVHHLHHRIERALGRSRIGIGDRGRSISMRPTARFFGSPRLRIQNGIAGIAAGTQCWVSAPGRYPMRLVRSDQGIEGHNIRILWKPSATGSLVHTSTE